MAFLAVRAAPSLLVSPSGRIDRAQRSSDRAARQRLVLAVDRERALNSFRDRGKNRSTLSGFYEEVDTMNPRTLFRCAPAALGLLALGAAPEVLRAESNFPEGAQKVEKKAFGKVP